MFCRAIASMVGPSSVFYTSLQSLGSSSNQFPLDGLGTKNTVLLEENDTSTIVNSATIFKNLASEERVVINGKHKQQYPRQFHGLVVLALNAMPKVKDKSDSFKRRLFIRQFKKRISREEECTQIKDEWLSKDPATLTYLTKIAVEAARDWYRSGDDFGKFTETAEDTSMIARFEQRNDDVSAFVFDTLRDGVDGVPIYIDGDGKTVSATRDDDMPYRDNMTPSDATGGPRLCALTFNYLWANFQAWQKDNGGTAGISLKKNNFREQLHECLPASWIPMLTPDDNGGKDPRVRIHKGTVALDVTKDGKARQVYGGLIRACILDRAEYGKAGE
jgi:phage/plasmid-associated DNA primase